MRGDHVIRNARNPMKKWIGGIGCLRAWIRGVSRTGIWLPILAPRRNLSVRLRTASAKILTVVVDHIERPTGN
jgi:hypothetical protein